jgi:hypothetical protein
MGLIDGMGLFFLGIFCIPSLIGIKSERDLMIMDWICSVQGIFGFALFAWGVWGLTSSAFPLSFFEVCPLGWVTGVVAELMKTAGGFILGFAMIQNTVLYHLPRESQVKAVKLRANLIRIERKLGGGAIMVGLWVFFYQLALKGFLYL